MRGNSQKYLKSWAGRHAEAEAVDQEIRSMAFPGVGETPGPVETFSGEDMAAVAHIGPNIPHMLSHEQVLRKWEVPDLPPSHHPGFGSSVAANLEAGTITDKPKVPHLEAEVSTLAGRMASGGGHPDPLGQVVENRRRAIQESLVSGDPDAAWYQGKAQALIHHAAGEAGVRGPVMRKTTAAESSKMPWDITYEANPANVRSGRAGQTVFPNIENAGAIIEASKGRNVEEAQEEVKRQKIAGVGRFTAAEVASRMIAGGMGGHEPIPMKGVAEKRLSFDVNLSDPWHPEYGHSPYVERHQLSAHTPDVQDARAGGYHEEMLEVPRERKLHPETGEPMVTDKGEPVFKGKPYHEEMLQRASGTDIATSTALVARTEEFQSQRAQHGEEWARQNAKNFMPGPSQSMQWSVARGTGSVAIPSHVEEAYNNRRITSRDSLYEDHDEMSAEDWAQM